MRQLRPIKSELLFQLFFCLTVSQAKVGLFCAPKATSLLRSEAQGCRRISVQISIHVIQILHILSMRYISVGIAKIRTCSCRATCRLFFCHTMWVPRHNSSTNGMGDAEGSAGFDRGYQSSGGFHSSYSAPPYHPQQRQTPPQSQFYDGSLPTDYRQSHQQQQQHSTFSNTMV